MNEQYKKLSIENEKGNHSNYNLNSFRGNYNHGNTEKYKQEKIMSPKLIVNNSERSDNKELELKSKQSLKPRLLTGKLPLAFDMNYKR